MASYATEEYGSMFTTDYRLFLKNDSGIISPFHDIPLFQDKDKQVFNMVCEIPRWSNAKMEICTTDNMNCIKQDVKKGKVRFVNNCFPHKGYIWNYGAIPQTWEDPAHVDSNTQCKGDGDPIDVCEIGYKVAARGEVKAVKLLGVMALIDEGETDWKVLAIDVTDPMADKLNDIDDVRKLMPGLVEATHDWFKVYKMPTGKPANQFAFEGQAKDKKFATEVVLQTHEQWKKLVLEKSDTKLSCNNVTVEGSPYKVSANEANKSTEGLVAACAAAAIPDDVQAVHYINREMLEKES